MRSSLSPGRHITDCQMKLTIGFCQTETPVIAAAKTGFSVATAYRIEHEHESCLLNSLGMPATRCDKPDRIREILEAVVAH